MITIKRLSSTAGLTIVELLLALLISLILTTGIYKVFVGSTTSYALTDRLSRVQENGRFAQHVLRQVILSAGYLGCLQDVSKTENLLNDPSYFSYDFTQAIYGLEATGVNQWKDDAGTVDPTVTGTANMALVAPLSGSDILVIRGINNDVTIGVTKEMNSVTSDLKMTAGLSSMLKTGGGDILMVTDCEQATIFQTTSYTDSNGNTPHNSGSSHIPGNSVGGFGHTYGEGSQVFFPQSTTYYIRNNADGVPSLYRKVNTAAAEELVEGVENMQILYGEDTDGNLTANTYVTADNVTDWGDVVSIRVGLLLSSVDEIPHGTVDTKSYDIDGDLTNDYGPVHDRRVRLVMSNTVGIRNRLH